MGKEKPSPAARTMHAECTLDHMHLSRRLPIVVVAVSHGTLSKMPDTGADTNIIGPSRLPSTEMALNDLTPPPRVSRFTTDGTQMKQALGSVYAQLTLKG